MYKNCAPDGKHNLCGAQVAALRKARTPKLSQRGLADMLQLGGVDVDKNAVQRIESGQRFVTDIELKIFAKFFHTTADDLLHEK